MSLTTRRPRKPISEATEAKAAKCGDGEQRIEIPVTDGRARRGQVAALVPGLYLRVTSAGAKSWTLRYCRKFDGKQQRLKVGKYPDTPLAKARTKALGYLLDIENRADPAKEEQKKKRGIPGKVRFVRELAALYKAGRCPQKRSGDEDIRMLDLDVIPAIGDDLIEEVATEDIAYLLQQIVARGAPIAANRTFAVTRGMFKWGKGQGHTKINPMLGMEMPSEEESRRRYLSDDEIRIFWRRTIARTRMDWPMRTLLKLSLVTGHRISEIAGMRRDELRNLDDPSKAEWHIPEKRMKHALPHISPLSPLALRLIKKALKRSDHAELVLPGRPGRANENGERVVKPYGKSAPSHAMRRAQGLNEKGERDGAYEDVYGFAEPVTPHDLRRTLGTGLGALKYSRFILDRVLAHKDNTISGVYERHAYVDEKREALEAWAARLEAIIYRALRCVG